MDEIFLQITLTLAGSLIGIGAALFSPSARKLMAILVIISVVAVISMWIGYWLGSNV
jgi:hypothetical protein